MAATWAPCTGPMPVLAWYRFTAITIIVGFSILALSNFIPSIYFGLLTGLAMTAALLGSMTLLPKLILLTKPFGPENSNP